MIVIGSIGILSMVVCFLVFYYTFTDNQIKNAHPSQLLALMSLCEFGTCFHALIWQIGTVRLICYFKLAQYYKLFKASLYLFHNIVKALPMLFGRETTLLAFNDIEETDIVSTLANSNVWCFKFFTLCSLSLNLCLCLDLLISYRYPFQLAKYRIKYYAMITVLFAITLS